MRIIRRLKDLPQLHNTVVTLGNFDGIHLGHQAIIKKLVEIAAQIKGISILLTFDPSPRELFALDNTHFLLTDYERKMYLIKKLGVDVVLVLRFNKQIAQLSGEAFVKKYFVEKIGAREIVIGANTRFGNNRSGDLRLLRRMGKEYNFRVIKEPLKTIGTRVISSTIIRSLIEKGNVERASEFLGYQYGFKGSVIRGISLGRCLGYPTANVSYNKDMLLPCGVFAVRAKISKKEYKGICNIGYRPTFNKDSSVNISGSAKSIEVHIFNFNRNIYGRTIEIIFIKKIRDEKSFKDKDALTACISMDIDEARKILFLHDSLDLQDNKFMV